MLLLFNNTEDKQVILRGQRVAQLIVTKIEHPLAYEIESTFTELGKLEAGRYKPEIIRPGNNLEDSTFQFKSNVGIVKPQSRSNEMQENRYEVRGNNGLGSTGTSTNMNTD